jgi:hypothetical protein
LFAQIERVSKQRSADLGQMDADLVWPAGVDDHLQTVAEFRALE